MGTDGPGDNVGIAYEYTLKVYDEILAQQAKNAERANKMILVIALVFAALSYGGANLALVAEHPARNPTWLWISGGCGLLAGIALVIAFLAAMVCSRIKAIFVPGTTGLVGRVSDPAFGEVERARILAALTKNVRAAIERNISLQNRRERSANLLNWTPQVAFLLTAVFVALTVGQRVAVWSAPHNAGGQPPYKSHEAIGENSMAEEPEEQQTEPTQHDAEDEIIKDILESPDEVKGSGDVSTRGANRGRRDGSQTPE